MRIKFIINPWAGKGNTQRVSQEVNKFCNEIWRANRTESSISFTDAQGEESARNLARQAAEDKFNRIVFVGGDGLLYEGTNGIMEAYRGKISSGFAIGIVPTGTGNNFAKGLKIPKNVRKALDIIKEDKTISVDLGKANNRFFVNVISFGFDARVAEFFQNFREKLQFFPKEGAYLLGVLKEIVSGIQFPQVRLEGEKINFESKVLLVAVTNSPCYGGIFKIAPGAKMQDGMLNICWIEKTGRLRILLNLYRPIQGTHIYLPEVKMFKASSFTISSPEKLCCEIDGETIEAEKEYKIKTLPRALRVIVPNFRQYGRKD